MIVYHGSNIEIAKPDILHSRKNLDFGCGFYVTSILEQAEKWVEKFIRFGENGIVNQYELDERILSEGKVKNFDSYSEEWLDFIIACRMGQDVYDYDLVIGGVANDRVFNTCELYFKGYIDKNTALDRLRFEKPNQQICLKNQAIIDNYLHFERSKQL